MTRASRLGLPAIIALISLVAYLTFLGSTDVRATTPFNPSGSACLEDFTTPTECDGNDATGVSSDIRTKFGVCVGLPASQCSDSNFGAVISFIPPGFTVPAGADIIDGSVVGKLSANATLGLIGNNCNSTIAVAFVLMDASVDNSQTNLVNPKPPGQPDVLEPLALDVNPANGIPDGVDRYPSFLNLQFDIDRIGDLNGDGDEFDVVNGVAENPGASAANPYGDVQPSVPRARLFGTSFIQGSWITLNFMVFEPGQPFENLANVDPALGYPNVTVLNDPSAPAAQSVISDFCAPLDTTTVTLGLTYDNPCTPLPSPTDSSGCPADPSYSGGPFLSCENAQDDDDTDADGVVNDGCPMVNFISDSASECAPFNTDDEDGDGTVNDGCPQAGSVSETGGQCSNDTDDDVDPQDNGYVNDGCPAVGPSEVNAITTECTDTISNDLEDTRVNDGCPAVGPTAESEFLADPQGCDGDADEASCAYRTNPATDGTFNVVVFAASQRDADGDGIENSLDVCSLIANPNWKPRETDVVNDTDNDGLPNACDPAPNAASPPTPQGCPSGNTGKDHEQDCFSNRQDNCPTVVNAPPFDIDSDGIGDACDPSPDTPNGDFVSTCVVSEITIGSGGTAPQVVCPQPFDPVVLTISDPAACPGDPPVDITLTLTGTDANPMAGVDATFAITEQPGTDASLGSLSTVKTTDDSGTAAASLDVGSTKGAIQGTVSWDDPAGPQSRVWSVVCEVAQPTPTPTQAPTVVPGTGGAPPASSDGIATWALSVLGAVVLAAGAGGLALAASRRRIR